MNPILVEVYRGGLLESFHRGVVCVVNQQNEIIFSVGDTEQLCYPRSAMKLLQVIPLIINGGMDKFNFTLEEIAVMCGSHNAESEHLHVVNTILQKIGLKPDDLNCGPQYPSSKKDANVLIKADVKPHHIHNNCSGKHAGMLATCVLMNWPIEDYINPNHPLQKAIKEICSLMYEYPEQKMITALDGCSAPIFSVPVKNQAIAYKNLVSNNHLPDAVKEACELVVKAVSAYPFMVAGSKRYCTDMMQITAPQIIGKTGAEGIFCMTFTEQKLGVCIKIDDGKMLPQYNVAQALINASGLFNEDELAPLQHHLQAPITNFNKLTTGEIKVSKQLMDSLQKLNIV
jgi:L-asparaginase II